jgi:MFS family permease
MYRPAINATVADLVPAEQRGRAYGTMYWAYNLGFSVAPLVAGLAMGRGGDGFFWLFVGDAATTLACGAILWFNVPETRPRPIQESVLIPATHATHATSSARGFSTPYRDRLFVAFALSAFLEALVFHQGFVALPVDMGKHGVSPAMFGRLIACNGILIVLVQPFVSGYLQRLRPARVLASAALLMGIGFGLTGVATTAWAYLGSIAVWTFGEILMAPVTPTVVALLAPVSLRGTYQGAFQFSWGGATLIGPVLGAVVLGRLGAPVLWWGCVGVGIVAAMVCLSLGPGLARRGALAADGPR